MLTSRIDETQTIPSEKDSNVFFRYWVNYLIIDEENEHLDVYSHNQDTFDRLWEALERYSSWHFGLDENPPPAFTIIHNTEDGREYCIRFSGNIADALKFLEIYRKISNATYNEAISKLKVNPNENTLIINEENKYLDLDLYHKDAFDWMHCALQEHAQMICSGEISPATFKVVHNKQSERKFCMRFSGNLGEVLEFLDGKISMAPHKKAIPNLKVNPNENNVIVDEENKYFDLYVYNENVLTWMLYAANKHSEKCPVAFQAVHNKESKRGFCVRFSGELGYALGFLHRRISNVTYKEALAKITTNLNKNIAEEEVEKKEEEEKKDNRHNIQPFETTSSDASNHRSRLFSHSNIAPSSRSKPTPAWQTTLRSLFCS